VLEAAHAAPRRVLQRRAASIAMTVRRSSATSIGLVT
jgi:hypothetical protein